MPHTCNNKALAPGADWRRVDALTDARIESMARRDKDNPATSAADWAEAAVDTPPPRTPVNARFDIDVAHGFKARGRGWRGRMNAVLWRDVEAWRKVG